MRCIWVITNSVLLRVGCVTKQVPNKNWLTKQKGPFTQQWRQCLNLLIFPHDSEDSQSHFLLKNKYMFLNSSASVHRASSVCQHPCGQCRESSDLRQFPDSWSFHSSRNINHECSNYVFSRMSQDYINHGESTRNLLESIFHGSSVLFQKKKNMTACALKNNSHCESSKYLCGAHPHLRQRRGLCLQEDLFPACKNRQQIIYFRVNLTFQITNSSEAPSTAGW